LSSMPKPSKRKNESDSLKGWQQIAAFLGQSVSVVQRWAESGMPVEKRGQSLKWLKFGYGYRLPEFFRRLPDSSRLCQVGKRCDASFVRPDPTPQSILEPANSASWSHSHLSPQYKVRASPFACRQPYSPPTFGCECCCRIKHVWYRNVKWFVVYGSQHHACNFHHLAWQFCGTGFNVLPGLVSCPDIMALRDHRHAKTSWPCSHLFAVRSESRQGVQRKC